MKISVAFDYRDYTIYLLKFYILNIKLLVTRCFFQANVCHLNANTISSNRFKSEEAKKGSTCLFAQTEQIENAFVSAISNVKYISQVRVVSVA